MKRESYSLQVISPCFSGGADPKKQAEIRAPAIRGQLRWWFRVLGGFTSLKGVEVRTQEARIFGATAGDSGAASPLIVRTRQRVVSTEVKDADKLGASVNSPVGYLLFPLRSNPNRGVDAGRGVFTMEKLPTFDLEFVWRGSPDLWEDIRALACVFGHIGSLGFRSRRAMGALAFRARVPDLKTALMRFNNPQGVEVRKINTPCGSAVECITTLAKWLRSWRQHGRAPQLAINEPGFGYARRDHNEGLAVLTRQPTANDPPGHPAKGHSGETFRPALGLPIIQFFSSQPTGQNKVNWEFGTGKAKGRFASPVVLRPHRDTQGQWHALVIFVDARQWPDGTPVFVNGEKREVSLELYEAMKKDPALNLFP